MNDLQKCEGLDCPMKWVCVRYTLLDDFFNWVFEHPPFENHYGFHCDFFIEDEAQKILNQFKDLLK